MRVLESFCVFESFWVFENFLEFESWEILRVLKSFQEFSRVLESFSVFWQFSRVFESFWEFMRVFESLRVFKSFREWEFFRVRIWEFLILFFFISTWFKRNPDSICLYLKHIAKHAPSLRFGWNLFFFSNFPFFLTKTAFIVKTCLSS